MTRSTTLDMADGRLRGTTAIKAAVLSALAFGASQFAPPVFLVAFLAGAPLAVERIRSGLGNAMLAAVIAVALVATAVSPRDAVVMCLIQVAPALVLSEAVARGRGLKRGCAWAFWLLFTEIGLFLAALGSSVPAVLVTAFERARTDALQLMRSSGMSADRIEEWVAQWQAAEKVAVVIYPAAGVITACLIVLAHAAIVRAFLARNDAVLLEGEEFESIRLPFALVGVFILAGPAVFWPVGQTVAYNVLLILAFFFALQGFAITLYFVRRMAGPPLLRALFLLPLIITPWSPHILAVVGLADFWFDVRRFADPPVEE